MEKIYLLITDESTDEQIADKGIDVLLTKLEDDEFIYDLTVIEVGNRKSIINALYEVSVNNNYYTILSDEEYNKIKNHIGE